MPIYYLSPIGNRQFTDANGAPRSGAKLFTYAAGTSTKTATYKDNAGGATHANPIVLDSTGSPGFPIWLLDDTPVKFVLAPSNDTDPPGSPIETWDNCRGINDFTSQTLEEWTTGTTPTYANATTFTLVGDQTSTYHTNRRIKATVTAGTVYGYVSSSAYGTVTTVTIVLDSGSLDAGLSSVWYGTLSANNRAYPQNVTRNDANNTLTGNNTLSGSDIHTGIKDFTGATLKGATPLVFDGATANVNKTSLVVTDPTAARTITVPDETGTLALQSGGVLSSSVTVPLARMKRAYGTASAASVSCASGVWTTLCTANLGTVTVGDIIFVSGFAVFDTLAVPNQNRIGKDSGTATITAYGSPTANLVYSSYESNVLYNSSSGLIEVTGSGTLVLRLQGYQLSGSTLSSTSSSFAALALIGT